MNEFFNFNNLIQIISAIIAFIAIVVSVVLYKLQTKSKRLNYKILSQAALFNETLSEHKLQVMFESKAVNDAQYLEVMIINNGKAPIESKDIEQTL